MDSSRNSDVKKHFASRLTSHVEASVAAAAVVTETAIAEEKAHAIESLPASVTPAIATVKA